MALNVFLTVLQQGLCYALVAMGVYITYKILDFPDLTVDGAFPLGGVTCISLIQAGCPFYVAVLASFAAGGAAGLITGLLHVKCRISNLLSGILTMTALLSVTLVAAKLKTLIPYAGAQTLFNNPFIDLFGSDIHVRAVGKIIILVLTVVFVKIVLDLYLRTKSGLMLRAVGNNEQMCTSLGCNSGNYKILGLAIADGTVALGGAIYSQYTNYFDNTSGVGMVVLALASVIIGCAVFRKVRFVKGTTAAIIGALVYTACLNVVIALGVPSSYLKLVMAVLFAVILILNNTVFKQNAKIKRNKKCSN